MAYRVIANASRASAGASMWLMGLAVSGVFLLSASAGAAPDPDTDGDGYSDAVETATHSNPLDPNIVPGQATQVAPPVKSADTDGDGLADADELRFFTNVFLSDSDGDGVSDGREINNGSNPLNIFDK